MLKLYDYPRCPYCQKVRVALAEKGLRYERLLVDLSKKEHKEREFVEMNPYGKVPVLMDGSQAIYESSIINEYLEEKYPDPPLMPPSPAQRARVRILVDFAETRVNVPWFNLFREIRLVADDRRDEKLVRESMEELKGHLDRLESELEGGGGEYLIGAYSLADVAFTPRVATLDALGIEVDSGYPRVAAWIEAITKRESFVETQTT